MSDMTLCDNVDCARRNQCYRYLEGLQQTEGYHSFFVWKLYDDDCDMFIDVNAGGSGGL